MDRQQVAHIAKALDEVRSRLDAAESVEPFVFLHLEDAFPLPRRLSSRDGVPEHIRELLGRLGRRCTLTVLSVRDRETIADALDLPDVITVGNDGLEIAGPDGLYLEHADARSALTQLGSIERELSRKLGTLPAMNMSRRTYSVELRYREASVTERRVVRSVAAEAVRRRERLLMLRRGPCIRIRPDVEWNARMAILWILQVLSGQTGEPLPIYLGRNAGAIRAVFHTGVGIATGPVTSQKATPHFRLARAGDAERLLRSLVGMLEADRMARHDRDADDGNGRPDGPTDSTGAG